jgi:hypothetical protein
MFPDNNYDNWISDYVLAKKANPSWTWDDPWHFSPIADHAS